jgi:hypothetical protein
MAISPFRVTRGVDVARPSKFSAFPKKKLKWLPSILRVLRSKKNKKKKKTETKL